MRAALKSYTCGCKYEHHYDFAGGETCTMCDETYKGLDGATVTHSEPAGDGLCPACKMIYPALTGSEKQVAWAEKLRGEYMEDTRKVLATCRQMYANNPALDTVVERLTAAYELTLQNDTARYWIDARDERATRPSMVAQVILTEMIAKGELKV